MQAHRLQIVLECACESGVASVGQKDGAAVGGEERPRFRAGRHVRHARELALQFRGIHLAHVGDGPFANMGKLLRSHRYLAFVVGHVSLLFRWPLMEPTHSRASGSGKGSSLHSFTEMSIRRTSRSGSGRSRSIAKRPFLNSAPSTRMPSASTNTRWDCREAIPRCRYSRSVSSFCRPRTINWFSSMRTSRYCSAKPATANVIRNRSPRPSLLRMRSILYGG